MPTFGELLLQHRRDRALGMARLARMLMVTSGYICRLEHGERHPSRAFVTRVVKTLQLSDEEAAEMFRAAGYSLPKKLVQQLRQKKAAQTHSVSSSDTSE